MKHWSLSFFSVKEKVKDSDVVRDVKSKLEDGSAAGKKLVDNISDAFKDEWRKQEKKADKIEKEFEKKWMSFLVVEVSNILSNAWMFGGSFTWVLGSFW